jgi:transcriptional regulator with XRE-family HTH domain
MPAGYSTIPSPGFIRELQDDDLRNGFMADHLRTRLALLIRTLREQRGWSQAELGHRLDKPQSVVSRLEDPDYGKVTLKTLFEVAVAFELPLYIDMPNWDEWFRLMSDMSTRNMQRQGFSSSRLVTLGNWQKAIPPVADRMIWELSPHPAGLTAPGLSGRTFVANAGSGNTITISTGSPSTPVIAINPTSLEIQATASGD